MEACLPVYYNDPLGLDKGTATKRENEAGRKDAEGTTYSADGNTRMNGGTRQTLDSGCDCYVNSSSAESNSTFDSEQAKEIVNLSDIGPLTNEELNKNRGTIGVHRPNIIQEYRDIVQSSSSRPGFLQGAYMAANAAYGIVDELHVVASGLKNGATEARNLAGEGVSKQEYQGAFISVLTIVVPGAGEAEVASKTIGGTVDFVAGVEAKSFGKVVGKGTVNVKSTIKAIENGTLSPRNAGYFNRELHSPLLGKPQGYWQEYHLLEFGGKSPLRILRGRQGEYFLSPDHYKSIIPLNLK